MHRWLIGIVIALILIAVASGLFWFFTVRTPQEPAGSTGGVLPVAADTRTTKALDEDFRQEVPESEGLTITNAITLGEYSLADWSDENIGGTAVFKKGPDGAWTILAMDGGVLDLEGIVSAGVPADIAEKLLSYDRY